MSKNKTIVEFILDSNKKHNNFYNYSKSTYINSKTPVIITCPIHGDFSQTASAHTAGNGCRECGKLKSGEAVRKWTIETFREKVQQLHSSLFFDKTVYENPKQKVKYDCPLHGERQSFPYTLLRGSGCKKCGYSSNNQPRFNDRTGEIFTNSRGCKLEIIAYRNADDLDIQFEDGTIVKNQKYSHVKDGMVKNYNFRTETQGFLGYGKFNCKDSLTLFYSNVWYNIFSRCYSKERHEKYPTYKDCMVAEKWFNFQNFAQWMEDNYNPETMRGFELDKDILQKGNKIYSSETCSFVPREINSIFGKKKSKNNSNLPTGVKIKGNKFQARISKLGKTTYLGTFDTVEQAFQPYKTAKEDYIKQKADKWKDLIDPRVYEALYNYTVEITD